MAPGSFKSLTIPPQSLLEAALRVLGIGVMFGGFLVAKPVCNYIEKDIQHGEKLRQHYVEMKRVGKHDKLTSEYRARVANRFSQLESYYEKSNTGGKVK